MKYSEELVKLVKQFEGFRARPYKDVAGFWTVGYGKKLDYAPATNFAVSEEEADMVVDRVDETLYEGLTDHPSDPRMN